MNSTALLVMIFWNFSVPQTVVIPQASLTVCQQTQSNLPAGLDWYQNTNPPPAVTYCIPAK